MSIDAASLPYHEPGIVTILTQSSFLLALNVVNYILDNVVYCGLLGQVFLGVAWGTPGAKWLGLEAENVIVQLGYLGLLLIVYEGGLSCSFQSLRANLLLSVAVAITGIALPIALSFLLQQLTGATPLQAFAAGAALCSTSLGTTFTVLGTSNLTTSRLGVVLTTAAMLDDVVGLVMVQVISNLGGSGTSIDAVTIVRPILVSLAFAVLTPLSCVFLIKPATVWLNDKRMKRPVGYLQRAFARSQTAFVLHTLILLGLITGSTYAGTSNLFAAYIAGACISWWDSEVPHVLRDGAVRTTTAGEQAQEDNAQESPGDSRDAAPPAAAVHEPRINASNGLEIYEKHYSEAVNKILKPFFFASIGFSIPITKMFSGRIVWRGLVYTTLMVFGKLLCGAWFIRFSLKVGLPGKLITRLTKSSGSGAAHFWGHHESNKKKKKSTSETPAPDGAASPDPPAITSGPQTSTPESTATDTDTSARSSHTTPAGAKPRSLYPASIIGCAMTARGEIGFLISSIAESNRIFSSSDAKEGESSEIFLIVTWAIVLCTVLGPLAVGILVRRVKKLERGVEKDGRLIRRDVLGVWGV